MSYLLGEKFKAVLDNKDTPAIVLLYWLKAARLHGCTNKEWGETLELLAQKYPALIELLNKFVEELSFNNPFMSVFYPHLFFGKMDMEELIAEFDLARSQAVQEKHILQAYACFKYFFPHIEEKLDF